LRKRKRGRGERRKSPGVELYLFVVRGKDSRRAPVIRSGEGKREKKEKGNPTCPPQKGG